MTYLKQLAFFLSLLLMPAFAFAQTQGLQSPLKFNSISSLIEGLLKSIVYIALPIISLFVIYAGFQFLTAQGNSTKIQNATRNLGYVLVGSLLILGAWALAQLLGNTINQLRS